MGLGRNLLKTLWEKEKLLVQAISPFPTMFSTRSKTGIIIFVTFNLLSANAFNLVWSKILLCGNGLSHYHTMPHFDTLKIYSNSKQFLLFHNVFYPAWHFFFYFKSTLTLSQTSPGFYMSAVQVF